MWAYLLDSFIMALVGGLLASPWLGDVIDAYGDYIDQAILDTQAGRPATDTPPSSRQIAGPLG